MLRLARVSSGLGKSNKNPLNGGFCVFYVGRTCVLRIDLRKPPDCGMIFCMEKINIPRENSLDSFEGLQQNEPLFDLEKTLKAPNPEYGPIIEKAARYRKEHTDELPSGIRMALETSHSEVWIPFLFTDEEKDHSVMGMRGIFKKWPSHEYSEQLVKFLTENLQGQIVVNLACGDEVPIALALKKFSPKIVIHEGINKAQGISKSIKKYLPNNIIVGEDALEFVSRLPENFCSFTISGLDSYVIPFKEYHEALLKEIYRAMSQNGILFGNKSDALSEAKRSDEFKEVKIEGLSSDLTIFEKKTK